MIIRVESKEQLDICLDIVHKSFQTVADEMILTKDIVQAIQRLCLLKN